VERLPSRPCGHARTGASTGHRAGHSAPNAPILCRNLPESCRNLPRGGQRRRRRNIVIINGLRRSTRDALSGGGSPRPAAACRRPPGTRGVMPRIQSSCGDRPAADVPGAGAGGVPQNLTKSAKVSHFGPMTAALLNCDSTAPRGRRGGLLPPKFRRSCRPVPVPAAGSRGAVGQFCAPSPCVVPVGSRRAARTAGGVAGRGGANAMALTEPHAPDGRNPCWEQGLEGRASGLP
jgi:hypothetical protein